MPQVEDIINATSISIKKQFDSVSDKVLPYFKNVAESIMKTHDPVDALQRALAIISGYSKDIQHRSLLGSMDGYITYVIETKREIWGKSYVWNVLKDFYSEEIINDMKGMRMLANLKGVIFDLGKKHEIVFDQISQELQKQGLNVFKPDELPEL